MKRNNNIDILVTTNVAFPSKTKLQVNLTILFDEFINSIQLVS